MLPRCGPEKGRNLYSFAFQPDLAFIFKWISILPLSVFWIPIQIKFYEAGMDLGLSDKKITSFRLFQGRVLEEYEKMAKEI